jgi:hypothetical protein
LSRRARLPLLRASMIRPAAEGAVGKGSMHGWIHACMSDMNLRACCSCKYSSSWQVMFLGRHAHAKLRRQPGASPAGLRVLTWRHLHHVEVRLVARLGLLSPPVALLVVSHLQGRQRGSDEAGKLVSTQAGQSRMQGPGQRGRHHHHASMQACSIPMASLHPSTTSGRCPATYLSGILHDEGAARDEGCCAHPPALVRREVDLHGR